MEATGSVPGASGGAEVTWVRLSTCIPVVLAFAALLGGCGSEPEPTAVLIRVPTQPQLAPGVATSCMDALTSGILVADARWGIALGQPGEPTMQVIWPAGFVGRQTDGLIELLDANGRVVGTVGQAVTIAGGFAAPDAWWACGPPAPPP